MQFLKKGLFETKFMQTRIKTHSMSGKEKALGYALGPGFTMLYFSMVLSLRELFYMQIMQLNVLFNNNYTYFALQTVSSVIGVTTGILINYITERTVSKAGRFRPYVLIGTWIMALSGIAMFWTPFAYGSTAQLVWLYAANIIYYGLGVVLYDQRLNVISVSTRNVLERNFVTTLRTTISNMIPGMFGAIVVMGFLYDTVLLPDTSGNYWRLFIALPAVIAMIFSVIEYFYTRERITEENREMLKKENSEAQPQIPLGKQLKILLTNKYFIMSAIVMMGAIFYGYLQGANSRTYMIQYILGGNAENNYQFLYLMLSMQPMAIGTFVIPAISKKFGARKIMMVSAVITLVGIAIALINPYSFATAIAGGFIFACGIFAVTNMYNVFTQQAADDIEHKHGFRAEGTFANGLVGAIYTLILTPFSSIYETVLSNLGFKAPVTDAAGITTVFEQNEAVNNWMLFSYYGSYAIFAVIVFVVCIFFDVEKRLPEIRADLKERRKQAVLARGEEWIDEEELERLKIEEAQRLTEENRIRDLKEKCEKKGRDFEKENAKYLAKVAKKEAKKTK